MANQIAKRDENRIPNLLAITDDANQEIRRVLVNPSTGRLLISAVISASITPVFTTTQRNTLTPSAGWLIFNSTVGKLQVYNGTAWETVTSSL